MEMLCGGEVTSLDPERVSDLGTKQADAMGKDEAGHLASFGMTLRFLAGFALNKVKGPMAFDYAMLDPMKIDEAKRAATEEERRIHGDGGVPFLSRNDVLTSWLMTSSTSK